MRVLFDTIVVMDLMVDREPHAGVAAALLSRLEMGGLTGYLCATTLTTVYYLADEIIGEAQARHEVRKLLMLFEVAPVNRLVIEEALAADFEDLDDALVHQAAVHVGADALVTRNLPQFARAELPVYSPDRLLSIVDHRGRAHARQWIR